jgi:hypothetical protein
MRQDKELSPINDKGDELGLRSRSIIGVCFDMRTLLCECKNSRGERRGDRRRETGWLRDRWTVTEGLARNGAGRQNREGPGGRKCGEKGEEKGL